MGKEIEGPKVIAPKSDPRPEPQLPPAGDERREVLAEREDVLQQQAEELAGLMQVEAINPKAFEPDNDILAKIDMTQVPGALPEYRYCWVMNKYAAVQRKLARKWQLVDGAMPEALALKQADGTRRLGDTILMRIRQEFALAWDKRAELRRRAREEGISARLLELRDKYKKTGVKIYGEGDVPEELLEKMSTRAEARRQSRNIMDAYVRGGRVPGMPLRRGRRVK